LGEHAPKWTAIGGAPKVEPGAVATIETAGAKIVLCRVGPSLYAYRDTCPECDGAIHTGLLEQSVLSCPSCGQRYDVRLAGRSVENREVHLEPVPLLEDAAGVRVALAEASP
jgi:nitrite reductase/ring-hydroxylating ferredoxin subunit